MTIRTVSTAELKKIANNLFGIIVSDLRDDMAQLRQQQEQQHESIISLHAQTQALNQRIKSEFMRSEKSRAAILKRLAEVENAARQVS